MFRALILSLTILAFAAMDCAPYQQLPGKGITVQQGSSCSTAVGIRNPESPINKEIQLSL